ncbi:MAG: hypothetical protein WDO71_23290 [Bacteroidota bacterium]
MKKYLIPLAALVMVAGMANAQSTPKKTTASNQVAKTSKPAVKNVSTTAASTSPSASTPVKKNSTDAAIKRKHYHKKSKSVKPEGSK